MLQIPESDVEAWIVRAVSSGLVEARMDQAASTVTVHRTIQRDFTPAQWASLKDRLDAWGGHVDAMLGEISRRV